MGCVVLGEPAKPAKSDLIGRLQDAEPIVQLQAARALTGMGETEAALPKIRHSVENAPNSALELQAVLAIDQCDLLAADPNLRESLNRVTDAYAKRVAEHLLATQ